MLVLVIYFFNFNPNQSAIKLINYSTNQPINLSTNQLINQSTIQPNRKKMKSKLIGSILFCFIIFPCFGQDSHQAIISGKVLKPVKNYMLLYYESNLGFQNCKDSIWLNKDGSFTYNWKFDPDFVFGRLEVSPTVSIQLWAINNGSIDLVLDESTKNTLFAGSLGVYSRFLNIDAGKYHREVDQFYRSRNPKAVLNDTLNNDYYYAVEDSIFLDRIKMADNYTPFRNVPGRDKFLWFYKTMITIRHADIKLDEDGAILRLKQFQDKSLIKNLPTPFEFPESLNLGDSNIYKISSTVFFLRDYLFRSTFALKKANKSNIIWNWDNVYANIFKTIDKMEQPGTYTNSIMKAAFMKIEVQLIKSKPYQEDTTEAIYQKYVDMVVNDSLVKKQSTELLKYLKQKLNELGKLKKGTPAPIVKLLNEKDKIIGLEKYKGKFIYIDVWASWCGPCIAEIPYWNELVQKYKKDSRVVFLTISIDDDKSKWQKALAKFKPLGEHLLSAGGFNSEFSKAFYISSVPSNILIDPDGKMLQQKADRAKEIELEKIISQ